MLNNKTLINLFHILVVAPLLWLLATDRLSQDNKKYILWLALGIVLYHLYRLISRYNKNKTKEYMETVFGSNIHHVQIFDSLPGYDQSRLKVRRGDVVKWTNVGEVEHSVTANRGEFDSGHLKPSQTFSVKFENLGEYYYYCKGNKGWMKGLVTVVEREKDIDVEAE